MYTRTESIHLFPITGSVPAGPLPRKPALWHGVSLTVLHSEDQYRILFESNPLPMFVCDLETLQFLAVNDAAVHHYGYSREEFLAMTVKEIRPPEEIPRLLDRISKISDGLDFQGIWRHRKKDGTIIDVEITTHTLIFEGRRAELVLVNDITDRNRAERRLACQYAVSQVLAESATLSEATPKIIQAICGGVGWDMGAIWRVDHQADLLRCVEQWHLPSVDFPEFEVITSESTFSPSAGMPGRVWTSGKPAWIVDVAHDTNFPRAAYAAKAGLHGAFGFPIMLGGEVLGIIEFFSREIRQPDDELLRMFAAIGSQIGQFIERKQAEMELGNSISLLRATLESTADGILVVSSEGKMVSSNQRFVEMWRIPESIAASHDDNQALAFVLDQLKEPEIFINKVKELYSQPDAESFDILEFKDGRLFERYSRPQRIGEKGVGRVWSFRDVTEKRRAEEGLKESEERFRSVAQSANDAIISANSRGRIISWNNGARNIFGYEEEEVLGSPVEFLMPERYKEAHQKGLERIRLTGKTHIIGKTVEMHGQRKDGTEFPVELSLAAWTSRKETFYSCIIRDITERKAAEEKIKHMAYHDPLTDLPNRALFYDRLQHAILAGKRENKPAALLLLDLNSFKEINDTFGHYHGDRLLQHVGMRIQDTLRKSDTIARMGGDEFAVILPGTNMEGAVMAGHKILEVLERSFKFGETILNVGASIGIVLCPDHGENPDLLVHRADMAMYAAKQSSRGYVVYAPGQEQGSPGTEKIR